MESTKQKVIGCLLAAGLLISLCSGVLIWTFSVAGVYRGTYTRKPITDQITDAGALNYVPIMIAFFAIGVLVMIGAVIYGFVTIGNENKGPRERVPNFRIMARYVIDGTGQMLTDEFDIEIADRPRFYVRAIAPYREVLEYETSGPTYFQAGEGMTGEAELQGKWLGLFVPYIGVAPTI